MNVTDAEQLNARFALEGVLRVVELAPSYPVLEISNPYATARIALHGGQVLAYQPHGADPVLWCSQDAIYREGASVRGGIPVCWPWFGAQGPVGSASHGFVRNGFWHVEKTGQKTDGLTQIVLACQHDERSLSLWPHPFRLQLSVSIGSSLSLTLAMTNLARVPVDISAALHSYFQVGDIADVRVQGFDGTTYLDALQNFASFTQQGDIVVDAELDRVFLQTHAQETIVDRGLGRRICLRKRGSHSSVVWNPWVNKSSRMGDFEAGGYRNMVCVETANVFDDARTLRPGQSHSLGVEISVLSLEMEDRFGAGAN